jgi:transposase-like protein
MRAEVWVGPERRRRWTVEEKVATVREALAPGARVAEVARRVAGADLPVAGGAA